MNSTTVDFLPIVRELLLTLAIPAAAVLAGWISQKLAKWLKLKSDSELRQVFETAAHNGLTKALSRLPAGVLTLDMKNQAAADAARYMQSTAADTLKALGVTPAAVHDALVARLESLPPAAPVVNPDGVPRP